MLPFNMKKKTFHMYHWMLASRCFSMKKGVSLQQNGLPLLLMLTYTYFTMYGLISLESHDDKSEKSYYTMIDYNRASM